MDKKEKKLNLSKEIDEFFSAFDMESGKQHIKDMLFCALTTETGFFSEPLERANAITFTEHLGKLILAAHDSHLKKKKN
jgi:thermostable 8-oxoguanine DNA glycosylase